MMFPPLPRIMRTTSFRSTLLYAGTFMASVASLAIIVILSISAAVTRQIDTTVANEIAEVQSDAGDRSPEQLRLVVFGMIEHSPGMYYLLEGRTGHVMASNMGALDRIPGIRDVTWMPRGTDGPRLRIRGQGLIMPDGCYLFVGMSAIELTEMQDAVLHLFFWGGLITLVVALACGFALSARMLRRIEKISQASRRIVISGDLNERIQVGTAGDEFDHLAVSLNAMLERIQELMDGLQQVSSNIAHDLRTPLTRLCHKLESSRAADLSADEIRLLLGDAIEDVNTILETFSALLRIAQIGSGKHKSQFARFDLGTMVKTIVEGYQVVAESEGKRLSYLAPAGLEILGDEQLLIQLLANLIDNAIVHTPEGTIVYVSVHRWVSGDLGPIMRLTVSDNGPGIPQALHQEVIQRFARLDASRSMPGNGLGLSMVQAVADLHGAKFQLFEGKPGLRCILDIPVAANAQDFTPEAPDPSAWPIAVSDD